MGTKVTFVISLLLAGNELPENRNGGQQGPHHLTADQGGPEVAGLSPLTQLSLLCCPTLVLPDQLACVRNDTPPSQAGQ